MPPIAPLADRIIAIHRAHRNSPLPRFAPALSRHCRWPSHATIAPTRSIRIAPGDRGVIA
jgi:hypothetical protein